MKILSPAGNLQSLKMAIAFGADEIYLGINDFNARNNIDGFTLDSLGEAVDLCHLFGVKVSLAINILFSNNELHSALSTVIKAYNLGVDSFIVQDIALAYLINKNVKGAVLHASTQMGIHNLEGVNAILPYGFSRVVLSRETPIEEIKRIKENTDIEIEYFVHGALCVSFSGNCYLSSYLNDASGNRGKCKQLCRLPYSLYKADKLLKNGYLLSAKDFNMLSKLKELENAGVDVLKIEGRARRPFYVATATREYKNALNNKKADLEQLDLAFNRSSNCGYLNGNGQIISNFSSHTGLSIGKITNVINKKNYSEVYFTSTKELSAKSTFKTFNNGIEKQVFSAFDLRKISPFNYMLTTTTKIDKGDSIHLIIDYENEKNILETEPKLSVPISITVSENQPIRAEFLVNGILHTVYGEILQPAKNSPLTREEIMENFAKSSLFDAKLSIKILDKTFLAKKQLNEFRRKVFDYIYCCFTSPFKRNFPLINEEKINQTISCLKSHGKATPLEDFEFFTDLKEVKNCKNKNVVYSPQAYNIENVVSAKKLCESLDKTLILDLPNFALKDDVSLLKDIIEKTGVCYVCNNYYSLNFNGEKIIGGGLNIYNDLSALLFNAKYLTAELSSSAKIDFPYMTLRHCPYKNHLKASCFNCPHQEDYYLKMPSGKRLKITRKKLSTCTFYLTE